MCAQLGVWQRTEPWQWQGRDRDLLPASAERDKRWRWLHWLHTCTLHTALLTPGERWHIVQWSPCTTLNIRRKMKHQVTMVTVGTWMKGVRELRYVTRPQTTPGHPGPGPLPCRHMRTHNLPHTGNQLIPDTWYRPRSISHIEPFYYNQAGSVGIISDLHSFLWW